MLLSIYLLKHLNLIHAMEQWGGHSSEKKCRSGKSQEKFFFDKYRVSKIHEKLSKSGKNEIILERKC